ncbi:MAG: hypothetical protein AAFU72_11945 [Pseudomonadota bacterium]
MMNDVKEGARLLLLAETAEKHLKEHGHDVAVAANDDLTAFDINPTGDGERFCRVQAIGRESWEVVRANGETLTGIGSEQTFLTMIERVVGSGR